MVAPDDSFTSVKERLLEAAKATQIKAINGQPLPSEPDDLILGVLIDENEPNEGWVGLEIPELEDDTGKKGSKNSGVLNATPMGAGLRDGSVLAFRFRNEASDADDLVMDDEKWDVVMPDIDDDDGSQMNEAEEV